MKPLQCGFDGERGILIDAPCPEFPKGLILKIRRGKKPPKDESKLRNMLVWYYPDGEEPRLLYCNEIGQWFDLNFVPTSHPFHYL